MKSELWLTLSASLLGSWHCAGMCGPFCSFLSKTRSQKISQTLYHGGRLLAYLFITTLTFYFLMPARFLLNGKVFYFLLLIWLALAIWGKKLMPVRIPKFFSEFYSRVVSWESSFLGFFLGVLTAFLPCVWLYSFVAMAALHENVERAWLSIFVFWIGTLPALLASQFLFSKLNWRVRKYSRKASFALLMGICALALLNRAPGHKLPCCDVKASSETPAK